MKKNTSDTKYAIMGVITIGCRTGYDIKQMIDRSLNHFWKISYGQIYPTLKQLVEEELAIVKNTSQDSRPDKKEYFLTEKGEEELQKWLEQPIHELSSVKDELLLKIFFSRRQSKEKTMEHLNQYKEKLKQRLDVYQSIETFILNHHNQSDDAPYWLFTLDYGKRITETSIQWCEDTISKLKILKKEV